MDACGPSLLLEPVLTQRRDRDRAAQRICGRSAGRRCCCAPWPEESASRPSRISSPAARFDTALGRPRARAATARAIGSTATRRVVLHAGLADTLLVSARTAGEAGDRDGCVAVLVARGTPGLQLDEYAHRRRPARRGRVPPGRASCPRHIGSAPQAPRWRRSKPPSTSASPRCVPRPWASCRRCSNATVEYLRTRQQFGQPIGRFQALQHRVADMVIHLEQARSMSYLGRFALHVGRRSASAAGRCRRQRS